MYTPHPSISKSTTNCLGTWLLTENVKQLWSLVSAACYPGIAVHKASQPQTLPSLNYRVVCRYMCPVQACAYCMYVRDKINTSICPTSYVRVSTVVPSSLGSWYRRDSGASVDHSWHLRLIGGANEVRVDVSGVGHQLVLPCEGVGRLK